MKTDETLENLKKQLKQVEVTYHKIQGAIEVLEELQKEAESEDKSSKKEKKS
jgi:hypothetical protein|tara:strand:+ start:2833 stop:2988 length:156 start_codon:yes stop_codon:yes gene_type:complete